jgi:hypothetical protein
VLDDDGTPGARRRGRPRKGEPAAVGDTAQREADEIAGIMTADGVGVVEAMQRLAERK